MASEVVDEIIAVAVWLRASDIHFDPVADHLAIRFRIHGKLIDADAVSHVARIIPRQVVGRLKVLARLSLTEQRRPQDGQVRLETPHGAVDVRVATMPTVRGERVVARLLPADTEWRTVASLGLEPAQLHEVRKTAAMGGMILIAGRVGVGKSTTLHAILAERSQAGDSVLTIEDPVERKMDDYNQVEVDERVGLTFAEGLRNALRQDPDVLMVGEIRDEATAQIAVRAGLIGHLMLSTIHADNAEQVVLRLLELGIDAPLLASALRLVIWQTLAPILCEHCHGRGCGDCIGLGLVGRRAIFSLLRADQIVAAVGAERGDKLRIRSLRTVRSQWHGDRRLSLYRGSGAAEREGDIAVAEQAQMDRPGYGVSPGRFE
ncbi:MAG: GspE/PulE family protein [Bacilli bacterium]